MLTCNEEELGECSEALEVYLLWGRDLPGGKPLQWYTRVAASQGCVSKYVVWWAHTTQPDQCDSTLDGGAETHRGVLV